MNTDPDRLPIANPALLAAFAVLAGAAFGMASEWLAGLLTGRRTTEPAS